MTSRDNHTGGRILRRVCLCRDGSPNAQKICPPRRSSPPRFSEGRERRSRPPAYTPHNVNRLLKFHLANVGHKDSQKFISKPFRRGANQELLTAGNPLEVTKGRGGWRGSGFRSYADIGMGHTILISRALIAHSDNASSEDERVAKYVADKRRRRQRWRMTAAKTTVLSSSSFVSSTSSGGPWESLCFIPVGVRGPPSFPVLRIETNYPYRPNP